MKKLFLITFIYFSASLTGLLKGIITPFNESQQTIAIYNNTYSPITAQLSEQDFPSGSSKTINSIELQPGQFKVLLQEYPNLLCAAISQMAILEIKISDSKNPSNSTIVTLPTTKTCTYGLQPIMVNVEKNEKWEIKASTQKLLSLPSSIMLPSKPAWEL